MKHQTPIRRPLPAIEPQRWLEVGERARAELKPLIIRGAFSETARAAWTPARLAARWPDQRVTFTTQLPTHGVPYREAAEPHQATGTLRDFVHALEAGQSCYLNQLPIGALEGLSEDFDPMPLRLAPVFAVNLWLGGRTRSGLHYDPSDNLLVQMWGRKWALLVGSEEARFLYPFADNPSKSQVDPEHPDHRAHPLFERCTVWTAELEAGDALFVPRGVWHFVGADDVSVSVNCWHGDSLSERERLRMFASGGWPVLWRTARDFVEHGLLGRPHSGRMFSPPPPGLLAYQSLRSVMRRRSQ